VRLSILACNAGCFSVSGTGDGFFSSAFQSQLHGNPLYNVSMPRRKTWFHYVNLTIFSFDYHLLCHQNVCNAQQTDIWTEFTAICQVSLVSCLSLRPEGDCCKIVALDSIPATDERYHLLGLTFLDPLTDTSGHGLHYFMLTFQCQYSVQMLTL